jgi:hypothetical protein
METVRRLPPVSGVAYTERSYGHGAPRRVFLNMGTANADVSDLC